MGANKADITGKTEVFGPSLHQPSLARCPRPLCLEFMEKVTASGDRRFSLQKCHLDNPKSPFQNKGTHLGIKFS